MQYEFLIKMNISDEFCDNFASWQNHSGYFLLKTINKNALRLSTEWILALGPDECLNEEFVQWLNKVADTIKKWLPQKTHRDKFNNHQQIKNLFHLINLLNQQHSDIKQLIHKRVLMNTYHLFTEICSFNREPLVSFNKIGSFLREKDLKKIRLMHPNGSLQYGSPDNIYLNSDFNFYKAIKAGKLQNEPISERAITPNDLKKATLDHINFSYANYLLGIKKLLDNPKALDSVEKPPVFWVSPSTFEKIDQKLTLFNRQLDQFEKKYLNVSEGNLSTKFFVDENKLTVYRNLLNAYAQSCQTGSIEILDHVIKQNADAIGLNDFFNDDFAKYCHEWLKDNSSYLLISEPNPDDAEMEYQKEDYLLREVDINVGLSYLSTQYEQQKLTNPDAPTITFLPVLSLNELPRLIPELIQSRKSQGYLGIYHQGDSAHFVFNFIYKWSSGKITVILIDSSFNSRHKEQSLQKAEKCFRVMLPGCDVVPLNIIQQFNGADCGICTLQNAQDVVNSLLSKKDSDFLKFRESKLLINPLALTLNAQYFDTLEQPMTPVCKQIRNNWEELFKKQSEWFTVKPDLGQLDGKGYYLLPSGDYNFEEIQWLHRYRQFASRVYEEFSASSEHGRLLQEAERTMHINSNKFQQFYNVRFDEFKRKSKFIVQYNKAGFEKHFPKKLEQELFQKVSAKSLDPILFDRIATLFISQYSDHLFPEKFFLDSDQARSSPLQTAEKISQRLDSKWVKIFSEKKIAGFQHVLRRKIVDLTNQLRLGEENLSEFTNQKLTYALLKQCVDIWQENHYLKPVSFIKKIDKIVKNRPVDLEPDSPLTEAAITSLQVSIRQLRNRGLTSSLERMVSALESTSTLKLLRPPKKEEEKLEITLDQINKELKANFSLDQSFVALRVIEGLKYIEKNNNRPDSENLIYNHYQQKPQSLHFINKGTYINEGTFLLHMETHSSWENLKQATNELVNSFCNAYRIAKNHGKINKFLNKINFSPCLEGSTGEALEWAATLGSFKKFDDLMEQANEEAQSYLQSTGKSLSLENKLAFISKHYEGVACFQRDDNRQRLKESFITPKMIKNFLDNLGEKEALIKCSRKGDLIDCYNNRNLPAFNQALNKADLKLADLNKLLSEGETLLTLACQEGKIDHVKALVQRGVNILIPNKKDETPFLVACKSNITPQGFQIVSYLLTQLPPEDRKEQAKKLLLIAYSQPDASFFKEVLTFIDDIHFLNGSFSELQDLPLLLDAAALNEKQSHLKALLEKNIIDENSGYQTIQLKTSGNRIAISHEKTKMSLARFAVEVKNSYLLNSLFEVINSEALRNELAKSLYPYFVSSEPEYSTFEDVLQFTSDPEVLNALYGDETLLTHACVTNNLGNVKLLLREPVDLFRSNKAGKNPLVIACEQGNQKILANLLKALLKKNIIDENSDYQIQLLNHGDQSADRLKDTVKGLLQIALDSNQNAIFFWLAGDITDKVFLTNFYHQNYQAIKNNLQFLADITNVQLKVCGLFDYINEQLPVEEIVNLMSLFTQYKQIPLAGRLLRIAHSKAPDELQHFIPDLLKDAYANNKPDFFGKLLHCLQHLDMPGLNLPESRNDHTLLTTACLEKKHDFVKQLLDRGVNLEVKGSKRTALQWAVINGDLELTKSILDRIQGQSVAKMHAAIANEDLLYNAYINSNIDLFKELLNRTNDLNMLGLDLQDKRLVGGNYFIDNYEKGRTDPTAYNPLITNALLDRGILLPDQIYFFTRKLSSIYDDLIAAFPPYADKELKEIRMLYLDPIMRTVDLGLKYRLAKKAEESISDQELKTLFQKLGYRILQIKLKFPKGKNYGFSNIHRACDLKEENPLENLRDLRERALAVQKDILSGRTALHYLLSPQPVLNQSPMFSMLQKMMAYEEFQECVNQKDKDGRFPLHFACVQTNLAVVQLLAPNKEIIKSAPDRAFQRTPLHYACIANSQDIVDFLLDAPAVRQQINAKDRLGQTALHHACFNNNPQMIANLLRGGAHCDLPAINGDTPLHIICRQGSLEALKELRKTRTFYASLLKINSSDLSPLAELSHNPSSQEAQKIKQYLTPFYNLAQHASKLAKESDADSKNKAEAITSLITNLSVAAGDDDQKAILNALDTSDVQSQLFKPLKNNSVGFFKLPGSREITATEVDNLKQVLNAI